MQASNKLNGLLNNQLALLLYEAIWMFYSFNTRARCIILCTEDKEIVSRFQGTK